MVSGKHSGCCSWRYIAMEAGKSSRMIMKNIMTDKKNCRIYAYLLFAATVTIMWYSYAKIDLTMEYLMRSHEVFLRGLNSSLILNVSSNTRYLVQNSKCRIPDINIWDDQVKPLIKAIPYVPCSSSPLLTYTTKENNETRLKINNGATKYYSKVGVVCCMSEISRGSTDNDVRLSKCQDFSSNVTIENVVLVKCHKKKSKKEVYRNVHAVINPNVVQAKLEVNINVPVQPLSVLIISIDSVSRINSHRALPKTRKFLEVEKWVELKGYNKVGENTFPNVMAIQAGINESQIYKTCNPTKNGLLDKCNMIWYNYRRLGYVTAYAEDEITTSTFNFHKKGFVNPPTDYYFRPYMLATEKHLKIVKKDSMAYCTGPETTGERIMNIITDFTTTFKNYSYFGFFWMNTFSHNELNSVSRMDAKLAKFLENISSNATLNNTVAVFLSDHGMRFGDVRYTKVGWYEDKLPLFFIRLPKWFRDKFPEEYSFLQQNVNRLTTPFDLHSTLQHILILSGKNYSMQGNNSCPNCRSLFQAIPENRSCEDARIPRTWCTCNDAYDINVTETIAQLAGKYIVDVIENYKANLGKDAKQCAKFKLDKVIMALAFRDKSYVYISIKTSPEAIFEAPVSIRGDETHPELETSIDNVMRIDFYGTHNCVNELAIKKYCYCKQR